MIIKRSVVDFILTNYSQIDVMSKYFKVPIRSIEYCLKDLNNKINNPLRDDYIPSLGFMIRHDDRLVAKDWANDSYSGDIFDIVAVVSGLNVRNSKDFVKICNYIKDENNLSNEVVTYNVDKINNKSFKIIKFKTRDLNKNEKAYWTNGGINLSHMLKTTFLTDYVWFGNYKIPTLVHENNNPRYAYYFGKHKDQDLVKLYAPFGNKIDKFKTNTNTCFEAERELYKADTLIITKSRKDKFVIDCNLYDEFYNYVCDYENVLSIFSVEATTQTPNHKYCITSLMSESHSVDYNINRILYRFYNTIIMNTDYDSRGIKTAFYHYILYGYTIVMIGRDIQLNDKISDKEVKALINKIGLVNTDIVVTIEMFRSFVEYHKDNYKQKDFFEYFTENGKNKGEELVNNKFKI